MINNDVMLTGILAKKLPSLHVISALREINPILLNDTRNYPSFQLDI